MPHRVLADHIRTLCFGIADNVMPSNEAWLCIKTLITTRMPLRKAIKYT